MKYFFCDWNKLWILWVHFLLLYQYLSNYSWILTSNVRQMNFVRKLHGNIYLTLVKKAWKITIIVPSTRNSALWKSKVKVGFPVEVPIHRFIIKSNVNPLARRGCKLSRFNLQPLFMWFTNYNIKSEIIRVVSILQYFTADHKFQ